jgi:hypothetical protein
MTASPDTDVAKAVFWRVATLSTVLWLPAVLAVLFSALRLLAMGPYAGSDTNGGERAWVLIATAIAVLVAVAGSAVLARSASPKRRGLALGLAASGTAVGLCAVSVAFVLLRWAS